MKGVHKVTFVLAKIAEVLAWILAALALVLLITSVAAGDWLSEMLVEDASIQPVNILGMDVELILSVDDGGLISAQTLQTVRRTLPVLAVAGLLCAALTAMVFRNVGLIIKTSYGLTKHSHGATPFQKDVVRMIKEIGYFYIAIPVIELIMSVILRLAAGTDSVELNVGLGSILTALIVFSLAQIFDYGTSVQQDVDGLL